MKRISIVLISIAAIIFFAGCDSGDESAAGAAQGNQAGGQDIPIGGDFNPARPEAGGDEDDGGTADAAGKDKVAPNNTKSKTITINCGSEVNKKVSAPVNSCPSGVCEWSFDPALPNGLSYTPSGKKVVISGKMDFDECVKLVQFETTMTTCDSESKEDCVTSKLIIKMKSKTLKILTHELPDGIVDESYSVVKLEASGGSGEYSWSLVIPTVDDAEFNHLPEGLSLSPDGAISGTPAEADTFSVSINVTDKNTNESADTTLSLTVTEDFKVRMYIGNGFEGKYEIGDTEEDIVVPAATMTPEAGDGNVIRINVYGKAGGYTGTVTSSNHMIRFTGYEDDSPSHEFKEYSQYFTSFLFPAEKVKYDAIEAKDVVITIKSDAGDTFVRKFNSVTFEPDFCKAQKVGKSASENTLRKYGDQINIGFPITGGVGPFKVRIIGDDDDSDYYHKYYYINEKDETIIVNKGYLKNDSWKLTCPAKGGEDIRNCALTGRLLPKPKERYGLKAFKKFAEKIWIEVTDEGCSNKIVMGDFMFKYEPPSLKDEPLKEGWISTKFSAEDANENSEVTFYLEDAANNHIASTEKYEADGYECPSYETSCKNHLDTMKLRVYDESEDMTFSDVDGFEMYLDDDNWSVTDMDVYLDYIILAGKYIYAYVGYNRDYMEECQGDDDTLHFDVEWLLRCDPEDDDNLDCGESDSE